MGQRLDREPRSLPVKAVYVHGCTCDTLAIVQGMAKDVFLGNAAHSLETKLNYRPSTASDAHTRAIDNTRFALLEIRLGIVFPSPHDLYVVVTHETIEHNRYSTRLVTYIGVAYGEKQLIVRGRDTIKSQCDWLNKEVDAMSIGLALCELAGWVLDDILPVGLRDSTK